MKRSVFRLESASDEMPARDFSHLLLLKQFAAGSVLCERRRSCWCCKITMHGKTKKIKHILLNTVRTWSSFLLQKSSILPAPAVASTCICIHSWSHIRVRNLSSSHSHFILPLLNNPFPSSIECILSVATSAASHSDSFFPYWKILSLLQLNAFFLQILLQWELTQFSSSSSSDATKWQRISIPVMTRCRRYVTRLICNCKYNIDDCIFLAARVCK